MQIYLHKKKLRRSKVFSIWDVKEYSKYKLLNNSQQ